jgi:hypothetical protein
VENGIAESIAETKFNYKDYRNSSQENRVFGYRNSEKKRVRACENQQKKRADFCPPSLEFIIQGLEFSGH